jgi:O-antigen/teichoic acid export membrane protein
MNTGSTTVSGTARFARQVGGTLGVRLMIAAIGVLSGIIIARWLGSGSVGIIASLNVMVLLAITFGNFGLPSSITFLVARDRTSARRILTNSVVFGFGMGTTLAALIVLAVWLRPSLMGEVPFSLVAIACAALPFQMVSYLCLAVYLGLERIRPYNLIDLSMQAMTLIGALGMVLALGRGVTEVVAFTAAANIVIGVAIIALAFRATGSASGPVQVDRAMMREMFTYGSRFFVAMAAGIIILRGDLLIVNYFRTPQEAGVYAVATQASIFLHMIPNVISTILFPRTSGARDEGGEMTCRVTRHSVALLFLLCLAAVPCAFLLPVLYGPAFTDLPALFLILLPGVFLLGIETIQVQHFTGLGLPPRIPIYWVVTLVFTIVLDLLFVPRFGALGAAAVSTAAYALIFVLVAQFFRARTGRSFSEAFVLRRDELRSLLDLSVFRTAEDAK